MWYKLINRNNDFELSTANARAGWWTKQFRKPVDKLHVLESFGTGWTRLLGDIYRNPCWSINKSVVVFKSKYLTAP
ncbi:hypothetical protein FC50_GL000559 [Lacticaseibacillus pantheris DSM 15945 = JCM 12539 = NBRC 106106]|uniref:Uncharacterized protein n=1 Tax=Lacticaseibacillus pantheris DSM 15945 = JCM 12539 = NBRC 106106 TaxID=1423783 RepID=A0A0R1TZG4_9LACO|nr:hypothetical protein FC50_GL000559 [Lacticaseibacillus pantheris DSM 15945 = JCM 12539 = NBRC 106106]